MTTRNLLVLAVLAALLLIAAPAMAQDPTVTPDPLFQGPPPLEEPYCSGESEICECQAVISDPLDTQILTLPFDGVEISGTPSSIVVSNPNFSVMLSEPRQQREGVFGFRCPSDWNNPPIVNYGGNFAVNDSYYYEAVDAENPVGEVHLGQLILTPANVDGVWNQHVVLNDNSVYRLYTLTGAGWVEDHTLEVAYDGEIAWKVCQRGCQVAVRAALEEALITGDYLSVANAAGAYGDLLHRYNPEFDHSGRLEVEEGQIFCFLMPPGVEPGWGCAFFTTDGQIRQWDYERGRGWVPSGSDSGLVFPIKWVYHDGRYTVEYS